MMKMPKGMPMKGMSSAKPAPPKKGGKPSGKKGKC